LARKDLTNKKIGKWTVIKFHGVVNKHSYWLCRCDCGNVKLVPATHLNRKNTKSCGCINKDRVGMKHAQWSGHGEISGNTWNQIVRCANGSKGRRVHDFEITIEYIWELFLKQNKRCTLTGTLLVFRGETGTYKQKNKAKTASLDRIDNNKGYIPGNVQWLHKDINMLKAKFNQGRFIELCRLVSKHMG